MSNFSTTAAISGSVDASRGVELKERIDDEILSRSRTFLPVIGTSIRREMYVYCAKQYKLVFVIKKSITACCV